MSVRKLQLQHSMRDVWKRFLSFNEQWTTNWRQQEATRRGVSFAKQPFDDNKAHWMHHVLDDTNNTLIASHVTRQNGLLT